MKKLLWLLLWLLPVAAHAQLFNGGTATQTMLGSCPDPYAATRVAPSGFPTLPILPGCVYGPGYVALNTNLEAAFNAAYPSVMSGAFINVDTQNGNDTTCKVNSNQPCATINKALRQTTATRVYVKCPASGVITVSGSGQLDFRYTDTGGTTPKLLYSQTPGCKLRWFGDNIGTDTWTATAGHPGVYQTTVASAVAGTSGAVSLVMYADGTTDGSGYTDEWGGAFPKRLQSAFPNQWDKGPTYTPGQYIWTGSYTCYQALATNTSSSPPNSNWTSCGDIRTTDTPGLANMDTLAAAHIPAWYYSNSTHTLYVYFGGQDLTNSAVAAKLQARYYPATGSFGASPTPRVFVYGTTLMLAHFYLDGMGVETQQYNNSGTYVNPTVYELDDTMFGAANYGTSVRGAKVYAQNVAAHANYYDGWNGDLGTDGTTYSVMELVNVWSTWNGDPQTYNSNVIPNQANNNNGVSSHNGIAAYIGSIFENNVGPDVADTSSVLTSPVIPSKTWVVGSVAKHLNSLNLHNIGGFQFSGAAGALSGDSRNRSAWVDNSLGFDESNAPLSIIQYANCHTYNVTLDQPSLYTTANACVSYTPDAP